MITLSRTAEEEIRSLARSSRLGEDLAALAGSRHNPFVKGGKVDVDAYLTFVSEYNEFINHHPKLFVPIADKDMRL